MVFTWFKKRKNLEETGKPLEELDVNYDVDDLYDVGITQDCFEKKQANNVESLVNSKDFTDSQLVANESANVKKENFLIRLRNSLFKTRERFSDDLNTLFKGGKCFDKNDLEKLEELLITSDIGVHTSMELIDALSRRKKTILTFEDLKFALKESLIDFFPKKDNFCEIDNFPVVVMVVGVNGVGKTTAIAKLAALETMKGNKVLIAAADTFRAAAVEQISIYAKRIGVEVIKHRANADPAAVAYDGVAAAISRGVKKVFIDTAGRLHTKINLMEELKKIKRSIGKRLSEAPHEVLLVLDATTGQNAISQVEIFSKSLGVTGIILTKIDGSAKGGVIFNISRKFDIPVKYLGIGEGINDLQKFNPEHFLDAMI